MTYKEVCDFLDELWHSSGKFFCWGCGSSTSIEHHHMISRQDMNKLGRPELLTDPENIIPLCRDCHHNRWHNGGIADKLKLGVALEIILDYYKKEAPELYYKLRYKIEDFKEQFPC